jgi:hypothetical protein
VTTPNLAKLIDRADGRRPSALAAGRKRRIVVRLDPAELDQLDVLRRRLRPARPHARAAVVRAFVTLGLSLAEQQTPPLTERCEPEGGP